MSITSSPVPASAAMAHGAWPTTVPGPGPRPLARVPRPLQRCLEETHPGQLRRHPQGRLAARMSRPFPARGQRRPHSALPDPPHLARRSGRLTILMHDDHHGAFRYRDQNSGKARKLIFPAQEFIRRFLQHVLPAGPPIAPDTLRAAYSFSRGLSLGSRARTGWRFDPPWDLPCLRGRVHERFSAGMTSASFNTSWLFGKRSVSSALPACFRATGYPAPARPVIAGKSYSESYTLLP